MRMTTCLDVDAWIVCQANESALETFSSVCIFLRRSRRHVSQRRGRASELTCLASTFAINCQSREFNSAGISCWR